jgi:hypothetical protein
MSLMDDVRPAKVQKRARAANEMLIGLLYGAL